MIITYDNPVEQGSVEVGAFAVLHGLCQLAEHEYPPEESHSNIVQFTGRPYGDRQPSRKGTDLQTELLRLEKLNIF